jgi:hypothetical protein
LAPHPHGKQRRRKSRHEHALAQGPRGGGRHR